MASDDHDERLWGALAVVALVVCVLNLRKTATSQDLSRVGSDFGRTRGHGDGEGRRERGWRWSPRRAYSASPLTIEFLQMV